MAEHREASIPAPEKPPAVPGVIVRRSGSELSDQVRRHKPEVARLLEARGIDAAQVLTDELGFVLAYGRHDGAPLDLDQFQLGLLSIPDRFRSVLKSRQIGFSFLIALEMLARSHLQDRYVAVCCSYNLDDAKEKVSLIKLFHDELPPSIAKKMVTDSKTEVGFEARSSKRRISKVVSFPSKAPRGKSGDIYLDEFALCLNDRSIYQGATALTVRKRSQLTIGSTPFGKRGKFYEIHCDPGKDFKGYQRMNVPWWLCSKFCVDVLRAAERAHLMQTEERVKTFGTANLLDQYGANTVDDFRQEYELEFQDSRVTFFPVELVLECCRKDKGSQDSHESIRTHDTIESLADKAGDYGQLTAGFDVGRVKHPSELYVLEKQGHGFVERFRMSMLDYPFQKQFGILASLLDHLGSRLKVLRLDATGMGMQLGEDLRKKYGSRVEAWTFTNQVKNDLANNLKILFEDKLIELTADQNLVKQLGSIKQRFTDTGQTVFDVQYDPRHHADKVWALALAAYRKNPKKVTNEGGVRILGEKKAPAIPEVLPPVEVKKRPPLVESRDPDGIFAVKPEAPRRPEFARDTSADAVMAGTATPAQVEEAPVPVLDARIRTLSTSLRNARLLGVEVPEQEVELRLLTAERAKR
jgi:phage FluMu gp28-like protein